MSSDTGNRPTDTGGTNGEKNTENRGGATRGPAGAIRRTQNTAPDGAGADLIQAVAVRAYQDDIDPEEIWDSVQPAGGGSAGAESDKTNHDDGYDAVGQGGNRVRQVDCNLCGATVDNIYLPKHIREDCPGGDGSE